MSLRRRDAFCYVKSATELRCRPMYIDQFQLRFGFIIAVIVIDPPQPGF